VNELCAKVAVLRSLQILSFDHVDCFSLVTPMRRRRIKNWQQSAGGTIELVRRPIFVVMTLLLLAL